MGLASDQRTVSGQAHACQPRPGIGDTLTGGFRDGRSGADPLLYPAVPV